MKINKQVRRFDLGEIRESSRTPQGFLKVPGFATRVGVFPYMGADGKVRRELRHPDDVFDPESFETLKYAPVTIEHPPEMVTPENVKEYGVGHTTERVEKVEDKLDTDLIIEDESGIAAVEEDGVRELSCGYTADIVEEAGDWNGAPYDFRQVNIRYNHLALVKRGRAGPEIRLRLDSADAIMQTPKPFSQESAVNDDEDNAIGEPSSKKIVISGREVELPSDAADTVQDMLDRFDEMRAKLAQMEEAMKQRKDKKDVDISQPGVSPQVKVEQQGPDGRAAGGKTAAKPGSMTGGGTQKVDDEEEEKDDAEGSEEQGGVKALGRKGDDDDEHDDDDESEHDDFEAGPSAAGGGAAMSPVDRMKADIESVKKAYGDDKDLMAKMDALEGKLDAMASESMGKDEKHADRKDSAQVKAVRQRVKLERNAERLVPQAMVAKFDSMSDDGIRKAVIKHCHPNADLSGKSTVYLQARFDTLCESFEDEEVKETRREIGRGMLEIDAGGERRDSEIDPQDARNKMIQEGRKGYQADLSAKKK